MFYRAAFNPIKVCDYRIVVVLESPALLSMLSTLMLDEVLQVGVVLVLVQIVVGFLGRHAVMLLET